MNTAIILAGGIGSRMNLGTMPKQYLLFHGRPIICYSLKTFDDHPLVDRIVIVADQSWRSFVNEWMQKEIIQKFYCYAEPGETRQFSILHGLLTQQGSVSCSDKVIIHDAARPFVSDTLITSCFESLEHCDGVMPVLPAKDTYYSSHDGIKPDHLLNRGNLYAGQAPEAFWYSKYLNANLNMTTEELMMINGTTEVAFKQGLDVRFIKGEERNFKVTTQSDIQLMETYLGGDL